MTEPITVSSADAPEPIGPNADIWEITTLLEVGPTAEGHWITQGRSRSVFLDSDAKALQVAAALVASVEKRRADLAEQGRAA